MKAVRNAGAAIIVVGAIGAVAGLTYWYLKQRQQASTDKPQSALDQPKESTALVKIPVPTQPAIKPVATSKTSTNSSKPSTKTSTSSKTTPTKKSPSKASSKKKTSSAAQKSA